MTRRALDIATASILAGLQLLVALRIFADATAQVPGSDPQTIVETAFDAMFNYPSVRTVRLQIYRHGRRVTRRGFEVAYKKIGDRGHTLLRFTEPDYLRDNALLVIEREKGISDSWLYQSSEQRIRRVNTSQRADSFYGSDLTFEDLEHHDWGRYSLRRLPDALEQERSCYVVEAVPHSDSQYSKVVIRIEKQHFAILELDFFKGEASEPIKSLHVPYAEIEKEGGILKPGRFRMQQHGRDSYTDVEFIQIKVDPRITDEVFTSMRLERSGADLFKLVERQRSHESDSK